MFLGLWMGWVWEIPGLRAFLFLFLFLFYPFFPFSWCKVRQVLARYYLFFFFLSFLFSFLSFSFPFSLRG